MFGLDLKKWLLASTNPASARTGEVVRWVAAALVFIIAPAYLAIKPEQYTPFVQVLISLILFWLAYHIGHKTEAEKARQQANDRWLPQAESVIYRLMTLNANVQRFSSKTKMSCSMTSCDLPELERDNMRAVKIKLKTDCDTSSQRLDDIAHQLEDAIEDWRRFVAANCKGEECRRIFQGLQERQRALYHDVVEQYIDKTLRNVGPSLPASVNNSQAHQTPVSESQAAVQEPHPPQSDSVLVE
jgi:hypothetical protein